MKQKEQHSIACAAAKAGFSAATGHRLAKDPRLPSEKKVVRKRRRPDPLGNLFEKEVVPMLENSPSLRSVTVYHELLRLHPNLSPKIRRTLERRIRNWRAQHGADQEVMFPQTREAGQQALSDFTHLKDTSITVAGCKLDHILYHFRLPWSGFTHVQPVLGGESYAALSDGLQTALRTVGGAPREHRTDSLSAAFRNLRKSEQQDMTSRYSELCSHYAMTATRNNRGRAHENGAIEAAHGHLKREIADALALRGSTDFEDLQAYKAFLAEIVGRINARHAKRIKIEREALQKLPEKRCVDYTQEWVHVTRSSGFILRRVFYTVPSRLINCQLSVRLYDDRLELYHADVFLLQLQRLRCPASKSSIHAVNYRHVIHSLKTKPMALKNLAYRDGLFPRQAYQQCYDLAMSRLDDRAACRLTVQLLALAHEDNCEAALACEISACLQRGELPDLAHLRSRFAPSPQVMPDVTVEPAYLAGYEALLAAGGVS